MSVIQELDDETLDDDRLDKVCDLLEVKPETINHKKYRPCK